MVLTDILWVMMGLLFETIEDWGYIKNALITDSLKLSFQFPKYLY
jgi:hypothetical protein